MPTLHQSTDEDRTLTNDVQESNRSGYDQSANNTDKISNAESNGRDVSECADYDDCIDSTLKRDDDKQAKDNSPFLAQVIVDHTNSDRTSDSLYNQQDSRLEILYAERNEIVQIEESLDADWLLAKNSESIARIARQSCRILDSVVPLSLCRYLSSNKLFGLHVCFSSFVAEDVGDLSLTKGDIIVGINQINEHWMEGQVCFDGQSNTWPTLKFEEHRGAFPLNHCWAIDPKRMESFCSRKLEVCNRQRASPSHAWPTLDQTESRRLPVSAAQSSSLSSRSSSAFSAIDNKISEINRKYNYHDTIDDCNIRNSNTNINNNNDSHSNYNLSGNNTLPGSNAIPPRPQLPTRNLSEFFSKDHQKSSPDQAVALRAPSAGNRSIISNKQHDKLRSWIHTVKKKTARLSTRITASLGLISLTRDEEFERHYESFKQLEKTIRNFIKNISSFVEHYESFLLALQHTSDNLSEFYRDRAQNQKELVEMKRKNKALHCEHFHAFKRTVDRQVVAVSSQLLQKFSGPHQLISKRSAKLIDYDAKTKEMESCRDLEKKAVLRDQYVIAKSLYDRINSQLINELPLFNQFALDIFRECILVLLESRRNLILAYTKQTANLLDTPSMASYTASDVASTILMSARDHSGGLKHYDSHESGRADETTSPSDIRLVLNGHGFDERPPRAGIQPNGSNGGDILFTDDTSASRPHSALSQLSSEFDQISGVAAREISSTPLSQLSSANQIENGPSGHDEVDDATTSNRGSARVRIDISRISSNGSSDNRHNESIESHIEGSRSGPPDLGSIPTPPEPPKEQAIADSDLDENTIKQLRNHLHVGEHGKSKKKSKKSYPIYVASWPFVALGPNQLTIGCNQQLKLIKDTDECGNADWSLVKDRRGHLGYVPSSYIKRRE